MGRFLLFPLRTKYRAKLDIDIIIAQYFFWSSGSNKRIPQVWTRGELNSGNQMSSLAPKAASGPTP